ncbi:MAG: hypothetical protein MJZ34_02635 [Paludibacteraceae bacterium]|nr:hypothetical protein [Paludibacteraceae bacterium]
MKVFISQPMKGLTTEQIKENRDIVINKILSEHPDAIIIDSIIDISEPHSSVWYLGESLKILSDATVAYFMDGWENANGCCVEHEVCCRYNINILHD